MSKDSTLRQSQFYVRIVELFEVEHRPASHEEQMNAEYTVAGSERLII